MPTPAASIPVATAEDARRRRLRVWIILASISIGWKVLVFTLGAAIPRWVLDDGIAALPAASRGYGAEARQTAMGLWNGPIERYGFVRMVRVMSVDTLPHATVADAAGAAGTDAAALAGGTGATVAGAVGVAATARCEGARLGARVRAYTYFAIPYSEVRTVCDTGHVEYRVFRRKAQATE